MIFSILYLSLASSLSRHISYTDLISSLLEINFVDPGSSLIHLGAHDLRTPQILQQVKLEN